MIDQLSVQMFAMKRAAHHRWVELERERAELLQWFPELATVTVADVITFPQRAVRDKPAKPPKRAVEQLLKAAWDERPALPPAPAEQPKRGRGNGRTPEGKARHAAAMRKYWATRRKAGKTDKTKMHWTQRPGGKQKLSAAIKRKYAELRATGQPWRRVNGVPAESESRQ